ncbi:succinate dehydrogenase [Halobacteriales archaeon QS_1_68_20]|nr:MAG: succinate dehydrogenase [Halobacteriales archaeon QS_1_68_20]
MAERYSTFQPHGTAWLLQRVTGAFLVLVLAFHFFLLHFVHHPADIEFAGTQARMSQVSYFATMWLFLVTATFHGVNGVYAALINQGLTGTRKRVVRWVLILAGAALIVQGTRTALVMAGV